MYLPLNFRANILFAAFILVQCSSKQNETVHQAAEQEHGINATRPVHWSYDGEDGPTKWSTLSPAYALCGNGMGQSPINIVKSASKAGISWKMDYKTTSLKIAHNEHMEDIIDNGHTIQVTVDEGSRFSFGDVTYSLKQFHYHTPSEHTIDGEHSPMEMHMVHQSEDGRLAVVGVMFKEGNVPNANLEKIIANLPNAKGENKHLTDVSLELNTHIPNDNYAYHYAGSLTTPPCSEGVQWLVLRDPIYLTANQIAAFSSRIGPNNRPTQTLNNRTVQLDDLATSIEK